MYQLGKAWDDKTNNQPIIWWAMTQNVCNKDVSYYMKHFQNIKQNRVWCAQALVMSTEAYEINEWNLRESEYFTYVLPVYGK